MSNASEQPVPAQWPEMEDPERLDQIIDIIAEDGAIDRSLITPEATLETLGLESMDVVMILMGAEEKLNIYLPMDNDLSEARNMSEFVAAIDRALKAGKPAEAG
ncbi:MAG: acyl carrier protein [Hoeflea sp.]|uniref:acyl carrier protein n=1 Tax=Hoeflea sp. TaxID=1940281 RepID=UPI0032ED3C17